MDALRHVNGRQWLKQFFSRIDKEIILGGLPPIYSGSAI